MGYKLCLADRLKERGISKREFAVMLDMDYDNVFRFFRAAYDPKLSMLHRWADALECEIGDLYESKRKNSNNNKKK